MSDAAAGRQIELVVFDLGRVLVRICSDWVHACATVGVEISPDRISPIELLRLRDLVHKVETNDVSFDRFVEETARVMGASPQQVLAASEAFLIGVYPGVPELLEQLHNSYISTACLSNTNSHHWSLLSDARHPSFFPLNQLKHQFASHLIHARKPDSAIYEHLEQQTGRRGPQILFFDDVQENVDAAIERGWHALWIDPALDDPLQQIRRALRHHNIA